MKRRLAAIVAADVVGYSRLMGSDEAGTLAGVNALRRELIEPKARQYGGRTVKLMGDGALMEFASAVDAVAFAVEVQCAMRQRNAEVPEARRIVYRIGINLGDIIIEGDDIFGDGVNIAARLETLAEPGGICVSGHVHDQVKGKLDLGFGPPADRKVKNIAEPVTVYHLQIDGRAERLMSPLPAASAAQPRRRAWLAVAGLVAIIAVAVAAWQWPAWRATAPAKPQVAALALPDKPSIVVLPFANPGGDKTQDYFSDGLTDDLITDLSQISGLFVIASNSSFRFRGEARDVRQVARQFGVRYVLEGSVRRAGDQVRINAQLVDASTGGNLWADRYDGALSDVFSLQDKVTRQIVSALAITLTPNEKVALDSAPRVNTAAYDLLLQANAQARALLPDSNAEARRLYEKSLALDPNFGKAHAGLALTYALDLTFGWTKDTTHAEQMAQRQAARALEIDPYDTRVHWALAMLRGAQRRVPEAISEMHQVLALDANFADAYALLGLYLALSGKPDEALKSIRTAMRLNPHHGFIYDWVLANVYFVQQHNDEAAALLAGVLKRNPAFLQARLLLCAIYGLAGRPGDAEWEVAEIETADPGFSIAGEARRIRFERPSDRGRYITGLRKAGLPD